MADKEKVVKNEDVESDMKVQVVKTGFFTKAGMFLDRHKKKVIVGGAAALGALGMLIFVGRHKDADEVELLDDGFTNIEVDATVEDID